MGRPPLLRGLLGLRLGVSVASKLVGALQIKGTGGPDDGGSTGMQCLTSLFPTETCGRMA